MKPSPRNSLPARTSAPRPRRRQTFRELRELQRLTAGAIRLPLTAGNRTRRQWVDGRPMGEVASEFIKPNERLTSLERLEIYNKQYWFRLLDCLYDDYPGLLAILGERKFHRLRVAYLDRYPSRSFTLRNLGRRLEQFIIEQPQLTAPHQAMALDMVRFEWAQVVAFDGAAMPPLVPDDLLGRDPARLRLGLQPYITLLEMNFALDDFVIAVKKQTALRSEASNAMEASERPVAEKRLRLPRPQHIWLAVHRYDNALYYKRLEPPAFVILSALRDGAAVAGACAAAVEAFPETENLGEKVRDWFQAWTEIGWFCQPPGLTAPHRRVV